MRERENECGVGGLRNPAKFARGRAARTMGRKLRRVAKVAYSKGTEQDSLMVEVYTNMRTIKAYGLEQLQQSRFAEIYQKLARVGMKSLQARHLQNPHSAETKKVLSILI